MKKILFSLLMLTLTVAVGFGQNYDFTAAAMPEGKTIVFRFVADDDMFYIPWQGNGEKLNELVATIDHYKTMITDGIVKLNVTGYSSALATAKENHKSAAIRANRVKSELIMRNGIKEGNFLTTTQATSFEGWKSVVVVTLRVPQISEPAKPLMVVEEKQEPKPQPTKEVEKKEETPTVIELKTPTKPYCFAVRTNLLYDAFLLPNIGIEWRISNHWGIKADYSGSYWGNETGNVQKMWMVSPEVRYYMGSSNRWYAGVAGNFGEANIYKGMLGNIISKDTGYQGSFWNAGISAGYQLPLSKVFAIDFNIGVGYSQFSYDTFQMIDQVRVINAKNQTKSMWGPTQAGITLLWTIGGNDK